MKELILSLNPFVRGIAIMAVSFGFAWTRGMLTGNFENAIASFFLLTALIYELLMRPGSILTFICRGFALAVLGMAVAFFFFRSGAGLYNVFGVAAMILIYELAILPGRGKQ